MSNTSMSRQFETTGEIPMANNKRILVAVDDSKASHRAVNYIADVVGGNREFHVGLLHLEMPPRMLEWGGSEDPDVEDKVSSERAEEYRRLEGEAIAAGQPLLQRLQAVLAERHIDVVARLVQFAEPLDATNVTAHILQTAKEQDYGTVVVGRQGFGGLKRLFRHHVGEELTRTGKGFTIWIVE
jgi:nucleotide-binding universal stress UspA family protein